MRKKDKKKENYLERIPMRKQDLKWTVEENGLITLDVENTGVFNRIAQKIFKKPKESHIHLDETGSFLWPLLDGDKNLIELGKLVKEEFGEKAEPLYERLAKYMQILESYQFIQWK